MSDPMSSGEIEDVLSSIRKLVTEDLRPGSRMSAPEAAPMIEYKKLILTPALRVVPDGTKAEVAPHKGASEAVRQAAEAGVAASAADPADGGVAEPEVVPVDRPEVAEDHVPVPTAVDEGSAASESMTSVVTKIGSAVGQDDDEWESETGDPLDIDTTWETSVWGGEDAVVVSESVAGSFRPGQPDRPATEPAGEDDSAGLSEPTRATDQTTGAESGHTRSHEEDHVAAEQDKGPDAALSAVDLFGADIGEIDEAMLREMVRDLIREELSGTLGERITRNVRKLVRAEINRALTARDFE